MTYSKKNRIEDVTIKNFSTKGHGVGSFVRTDGSSGEAEISFTIPGDLVRATLYNKRRGRWQGKIDEILQPSSDRIHPKCVHFATCGGCKWQQMTYETQLRYKQSFVKEIFENFLNPSIDFRPIVGSQEWAYRNKMEFSFSGDINKNKYLGLIIDSSKGKVVNLTECHLVNPWFVKTLKAVREWWEASDLDAYHMHRNTGSLRTLTLREGMNTGDRMVFLTVSGNPDYALTRQQLENFVQAIQKSFEASFDIENKLSIFLRIQQIAKGMETQFYEMHLSGPDHIKETLSIQMQAQNEPATFKFTISPTAFFQPNTKQAERFYSLALQMADINPTSVVYDLYCGTGTLGICASKLAKEVIGVEISPESSLDARQNAALNHSKNVTVITGDVREVLRQIQIEKKLPVPDVAFVDPPRAGLDADAMQQLIQLKPPKILYISCNPSTQAINVAQLLEQGYRIEIIQPVDQFPQTVHIENLILLTKSV